MNIINGCVSFFFLGGGGGGGGGQTWTDISVSLKCKKIYDRMIYAWKAETKK